MPWLLGFGMLASGLLIAAVAARAVGTRQWAALMRTHTAELEAARVNGPGSGPARYDERELEGLPAPVQRYFRAVLEDGQPIIATATLQMSGTINMSATGEQWRPFTSIQRVVTRRPGFLWNARVQMAPGLPAHVEDSYIAGRGRLVARLLGLFTVANAQGGGEMARGEFMRYFAEAPWYPTALLPSQGVQWQAADQASAQATLVDGAVSLTLLFSFDEAGLIASVRAASRGAGVGKDMVMLPWDCGLSDYQSVHGMLLPMAGEAAWIRPEGRKAYFHGKVQSVRYEFLR